MKQFGGTWEAIKTSLSRQVEGIHEGKKQQCAGKVPRRVDRKVLDNQRGCKESINRNVSGGRRTILHDCLAWGMHTICFMHLLTKQSHHKVHLVAILEFLIVLELAQQVHFASRYHWIQVASVSRCFMCTLGDWEWKSLLDRVLKMLVKTFEPSQFNYSQPGPFGREDCVMPSHQRPNQISWLHHSVSDLKSHYAIQCHASAKLFYFLLSTDKSGDKKKTENFSSKTVPLLNASLKKI